MSQVVNVAHAALNRYHPNFPAFRVSARIVYASRIVL